MSCQIYLSSFNEIFAVSSYTYIYGPYTKNEYNPDSKKVGKT